MSDEKVEVTLRTYRGMKNCLTCRWKSPPRTPGCSKNLEYAATCDWPVKQPAFSLMGISNEGDVSRHLNLATITPGSEFYNPHHAAIECPVWEAGE